ncbi:MAG: YceI family protein [Bdellovibrionales bacterium]
MKSLFKFSAVLLLSLLFGGVPATAKEAGYYVPPEQFNAAFQVMNLGYANVIGLFQNATGLFSFDPSSKTLRKLKLAVEVASMTVPHRDVQNDLTDLFAPSEFREISFIASAPVTFKDGKAQIKGTLGVHGQKKPAVFEATLNQVEDDKMGLSLKGSFKRADFGMGDEPDMPGRFGPSITLMLEMQGVRS